MVFPILIIAVKETGDPRENCHQQPVSLTQSFFLPAVQIQRSWSSIPLAPVVQTLDSAIQRIIHYPADNAIVSRNTYPLDGD